MIIVSVNRIKGQIIGYAIKGHAGYKPPGEDIVCAGVSMLAQTTLIGLNRYIKEGIKFSIRETGELRCWLPEKLSSLEKLQSEAILETMVMGLKNLQDSYSGYLRVFRRRWTSC